MTHSSSGNRSHTVGRVEIVLKESDNGWIGLGDGFAVQGVDIAELEERIVSVVSGSGRFAPGTRVEVFVACDRGVIPDWMRPYHSHYFNRTISFMVGKEEEYDRGQRQ